MGYTLGEAAKATGKAKSTISKAIKKGKISAQKDAHGQYSIEPSELFRVWPIRHQKETGEQSTGGLHENGSLHIENRVLQEKVKLLEQYIDDLKEDKERWRQQATTLLTNQGYIQPRGSLWQRITGKGQI